MKKDLEFDLKCGYRGLKISFIFLMSLILILLILNFSKISRSYFLKFPENITDFSAILGGVIIFIAIPFLISIKIGNIKKGSKNSDTTL